MRPPVRSLALALAFSPFFASCETPKQSDRWREGVEELRREGSKTAPWNTVGMRAPGAPTGGAAQHPEFHAARPMVAITGGDTETYMFNVSDLTHGVRDFAGPSLGDLRRPEDRPGSRDDAGGESVPVVDEDQLIEMVRAQLADVDGAEDISVTILNGKLIVSRE